MIVRHEGILRFCFKKKRCSSRMRHILKTIGLDLENSHRVLSVESSYEEKFTRFVAQKGVVIAQEAGRS